MTAKEEAKELVEKYWSIQWQVHKSSKSFKKEGMSWSAAKQCALIAVDEVYNNIVKSSPLGKYWQDVKKEIEKL